MEAWFIPYGATLTHLVVKDNKKLPRDVVLGWDNATEYCANAEHTYFGATIGRVANRIAGGKFEFHGKTYHTELNEDADTLHGGWVGFDRRSWTVHARNSSSVTFTYFSPDGEMGFPGNLWLTVRHTVTEDNTWMLQYSAKTDGQSLLAMTNHAYFNLNANIDNTPTVLKTSLHMGSASKFLEVDTNLLPTGRVLDIKQHAPWMDFTRGKTLGHDIDKGTVTAQGGYDNAWLFTDTPTPGVLRHVATAVSPATGIRLNMFTDQRGVQIYTGNFLNGTDPKLRLRRKKSQSFGPDPQYYHWRGAFTLEAQGYLDALHHPSFPQWELTKDQPYQWNTAFRFDTVSMHNTMHKHTQHHAQARQAQK